MKLPLKSLSNDNLPENVDKPAHYTRGPIEVIDFIESQGIDDFRLANVIKYISRAKYKGNELEDCQKALWYLRRYIKWKFGEGKEDAV